MIVAPPRSNLLRHNHIVCQTVHIRPQCCHFPRVGRATMSDTDGQPDRWLRWAAIFSILLVLSASVARVIAVRRMSDTKQTHFQYEHSFLGVSVVSISSLHGVAFQVLTSTQVLAITSTLLYFSAASCGVGKHMEAVEESSIQRFYHVGSNAVLHVMWLSTS